MVVAMLLLLLGLVSILGAVEVGYLYWAKRDSQKAADLAALAGAQRLSTCSADNTDNAAARGNAATDNQFGGTLAIQCGHWDPTKAGDDPAHPDQHFVAGAGPANAVRVAATMPLVPIFGITNYNGTGSTAVAANADPIAAFSVGSQLAGINASSPLNQVLTSALGTQLGLSLLSYQGIANADISLLDLVQQLPISAGTVNGVLNAPITVGDFLNAYVSALSRSPQAANIDLTFVQQQVATIAAQMGNVPIDLGTILNVDANTIDPTAALNTNVNALDILNATLLAADSRNAVALPAATVSLPGVAQVGVQLSVVEPPQIAVGGVGATAHTAQIRLALSVSVPSNPLTGNESLAQVPLYLEVAPTDATITAIQCGVQGSNGSMANEVTIKTSPGLLNAFLGSLPQGAIGNTSQSWSLIVATGKPAPLVNVNLLGLPVATLNASSSVSLTAIPAWTHTFSVDPTVPMTQQSGMTWPPPTTSQPPELGNVISSLLTSSNLQTSTTVLGGLGGLNLGPLLSGLTGVLQPVLQPLFSTLDTALVSPLLQVLGVQLGTAEVNLRAVQCNAAGPQLVY
ncbi:TadG family pilus assembly protein [Dyella agri]